MNFPFLLGFPMKFPLRSQNEYVDNASESVHHGNAFPCSPYVRHPSPLPALFSFANNFGVRAEPQLRRCCCCRCRRFSIVVVLLFSCRKRREVDEKEQIDDLLEGFFFLHFWYWNGIIIWQY
jgi:hypothetical protein